MKTVREHLTEFHQSAETHCRDCAKAHFALSDLHKKLADTAQGEDGEELHLDAAQAHRDIADANIVHAEHHLNARTALSHREQKTEDSGDLTKIFD